MTPKELHLWQTHQRTDYTTKATLQFSAQHPGSATGLRHLLSIACLVSVLCNSCVLFIKPRNVSFRTLRVSQSYIYHLALKSSLYLLYVRIQQKDLFLACPRLGSQSRVNVTTKYTRE